MRNKLQQAGLVLFGLVAGIFLSLNYSAIAQKEAVAPLPIEELRTFADVFNAIKMGYVEPVEDKKLITQAISGMLTGLDPHSQYLDADAFKDLQVNTHGEFGGLGIEVGMEDGFVKVISPIEDTPAMLERPERRALDDMLFDLLGLSAGDREASRAALVELLDGRRQRAANPQG